jgi:hypothetical protein
MFCKDTLITGVRVLEHNVNGVIWIKLEKTIFNTDADTYMCVLYIPPPGSPAIIIVQSIYSLTRNNLQYKFFLLEVISDIYPELPQKSIDIYTG